MARGKSYSKIKKATPNRTKEIDLTLAVLAVKARHIISLDDLAYLCSCSKQAMHQIEQKAIRKLRTKLKREILEHGL